MADILFVKKTPLPTFFFRRFSRIYPALLVYVIAATILFRNDPVLHNGPLAAVLALTFLLNYAVYFSHSVAMLEHLWSICVEEHAYLLLAAFRKILGNRATAIWVIGILGVASLINGAVQPHFLGGGRPHYNFRSDASVCMIFLSAVAFLTLRERKIRAWVAPVALAGATLLRFAPWAWASLVVSPLCLIIAANAIDQSYGLLKSSFAIKPLRLMGLWSYSIYLWQQPAFEYLMSHRGWWLLPVMLVAALASFYLVEQPARWFLNTHDPFNARRKAGKAFAASS
jgi:peptidoglycan/LPS O-acetylase OafA/YrhL